MIVIGEPRPSGGMPTTPMLSPTHSDVQVLVGGNETVCMQFNQSNLMHGGYVIAQIYQSQLESELKSLQTKQVSKSHGSGHLRKCPCV